jgi:hypothetical protein
MIGSPVKYYLYVNDANPHARVHREGCPFVKLHGGEHTYGQGSWREYATRDAAFADLARSGKANRDGCRRCQP